MHGKFVGVAHAPDKNPKPETCVRWALHVPAFGGSDRSVWAIFFRLTLAMLAIRMAGIEPPTRSPRVIWEMGMGMASKMGWRPAPAGSWVPTPRKSGGFPFFLVWKGGFFPAAGPSFRPPSPSILSIIRAESLCVMLLFGPPSVLDAELLEPSLCHMLPQRFYWDCLRILLTSQHWSLSPGYGGSATGRARARQATRKWQDVTQSN